MGRTARSEPRVALPQITVYPVHGGLFNAVLSLRQLPVYGPTQACSRIYSVAPPGGNVADPRRWIAGPLLLGGVASCGVSGVGDPPRTALALPILYSGSRT